MSLLDFFNPFAYVMLLRRWLYRRGILKTQAVTVPVISVGNLTMGGTGKSPMVMYLASYLMSKGRRVAIVSRGYRRRSKGQVIVSDGERIRTDVHASGDEPMMFADRLPKAIVVVDADRVRGAEQAVKLGADIILLDDGAQHLRLHRDLDLQLFDARRSLAATVPFGRGREPYRAVQDADVVLFTHAEVKRHMRLMWELMRPTLSPGTTAAATTFVAEALRPLSGEASRPLEALQGQRVLAVASIASPKRFVAMLEAAGADVTLRDLGDHARYTPEVVQTLLRDAERTTQAMIITTEKDIVKSGPLFREAASQISVLVLTQRLEFLAGTEGFFSRVDELVTRKR